MVRSKANGNNKMNYTKIIYFDEGSAADYMQIVAGGNLKKTTEFISEVVGGGVASASGEGSVNGKGLSKLFKELSGVGLEASLKGSAEIEAQKTRIAKTILENTLLSDFFEVIKDNKSVSSGINRFDCMRLYPHPNSFTYMMLMAPFFTMVDGKMPFSTDDGNTFEINVNKIEMAVSRGRGYYEFVGKYEEKEIIFRFSNAAFRNNYTLSDIPKMTLSLYAIPVGVADKNKLSLSEEFKFGMTRMDRIEYGEEEHEESNCQNEIPVYDVIVAGIKN